MSRWGMEQWEAFTYNLLRVAGAAFVLSFAFFLINAALWLFRDKP